MPISRSGRGGSQTSRYHLFNELRKERVTWFTFVLSHELLLVVIVLLLKGQS